MITLITRGIPHPPLHQPFPWPAPGPVVLSLDDPKKKQEGKKFVIYSTKSTRDIYIELCITALNGPSYEHLYHTSLTST